MLRIDAGGTMANVCCSSALVSSFPAAVGCTFSRFGDQYGTSSSPVSTSGPCVCCSASSKSLCPFTTPLYGARMISSTPPLQITCIGAKKRVYSNEGLLGTQVVLGSSCGGSGSFGLVPRGTGQVLKGTFAIPVSGKVSGTEYEFREDGSELEVRVPIPSVEAAGRQLTAKYVTVDAQTTSLVVAVQTVHGIQILLNAGILYGSIRPAETVWFVDETEVVLSLKKADDELSWPELAETWDSLAKGVASLLNGSSVYIVGESTEVNWAVAQAIATGLEYVPLQTQRLIEQITGASVDQLISGGDCISETEGQVLTSLGQHMRCVVATLGEQDGAASRQGGWNGIYAGFSVWLSQSEAQDEKTAKEEVVQARQVGSQAYSNADVVVALSGWDLTAARPTAEGALRALKYLLIADKDLPGKKSLYMRLGSRGDWPDIMPPGWDPARPKDEAKSAQSLTL